MDFTFLSKYSQFFINVTKVTITISVCTLIFGFLLGIIICLGKISRNKIISIIATSYIEFLRGTPLLVQLYIIYFGLPTMGIKFPDLGNILEAGCPKEIFNSPKNLRTKQFFDKVL